MRPCTATDECRRFTRPGTIDNDGDAGGLSCGGIYICEDKDLEAGSCRRILGAPPAELEILAPVDEIEVLRLGGAPDPRNCRRNQGSEASRSSRSSELSTKSRFRGLAELQVIENIDDIELRRPRGAPSRAFHADTGARRGALASISEESRSSKSSKTLTKSRFGGFEEFQVGNSTRTRERDGGLQPPIGRLVYIYIYI